MKMKKQIADVFPRILLLSTILVVVSFAGRNLSSLKYLRVINSSSDGLRNFDIPASHPRAELWTANLYYQIGEDQKAIDILEKLTSQSDDLNAYYLLGVIQKSSGKVFQALKTWAKALDGRILVQFGNQAKGVSKQGMAYRLAYKIDPELYSFNYLGFLNRQGNDAKFEKVMLKVIKDYPQSAFQEQWNLSLARHYFFHGEPEKAKEIYLKLVDSVTKDKRKYEILAELGKIYKIAGDWLDAEKIYTLLLEEDPGNSYYSYSLGVALYEQGTGSGDAIQYFENSISSSENKGKTSYVVGRYLFSQQEFDLAGTYIESAVKQNPSPPYHWMRLLSKVYIQQGNEEKAYKILERAKRLFPKNMKFEYDLGVYFLSAGRTGEARMSAERILNASSDPKENHLVLAGLLFEKLGEIDKAVELFSEALKLNPENIEALAGLERLK